VVDHKGDQLQIFFKGIWQLEDHWQH